MKITLIHNLINFFLLIFLINGCGGGGGEYYPPSIAINKLGIKKEKFENTDYNENKILHLGGEREEIANDDKIIGGEKYYYFSTVSFKGETLTLAVPLDNWISIVDSKGSIVKKLTTPRYTREVVAIELKHERHSSFLAIFVDQQSTSHSSSLFVLDSSFNIVYKEHLLGANWLSKITTKNGDILMLSSEDKWKPDEHLITIGGSWKYDFFVK